MAIQHIQDRMSVDEAIYNIIYNLGKVMSDLIYSDGEKRKLRLQNYLIGRSSVLARYVLYMKRKSVGHTPMTGHRKLTSQIMKELYRDERTSSVTS